jgi:hypothetical protein
MRPVETIPGMGSRGIKNDGGVQLWYIVRTYIKVPIHSHTTIRW